MKRSHLSRVISRLVLMAMLILIAVPMALAQEGATLKDLLDQFELYTFGGLMVSVLVLEELVDRVWNLDGVASQVRSIVLGILGATVLAFFKLFMFADPTVFGGHEWFVVGPLIGAGAAIASNFAFLLPAVRAILEGIGIRPRWEPLKPIGTGSKPETKLIR